MTLPRRPGAAAAVPSGPSADCTADSAGGLTFDLALPDGEERWDAALLLHRRGSGTGAEGPVRLPLFPFGEGRLRAALPSTVQLAEGVWDVYVSLGDDGPQRLRPGVSDLSSLVERVPGAHRTWLGVRVPYATRHGNLSVRAWLRWPHAEVGDLWIEDGVLSLRGRLYGAELATGAGLEARPRQQDREPVFVPADVPVGARCGAEEGELFCSALPLAELPGAGEWELWLRPSGSADPAERPAGPVRIARILDDVPEKQRTVSYPPCSTPTGTATPYYTRDNDLAVRVERAEG
ncbi:hypothetical protein LHJ74_03220 [Streptomyces sp. N2-109]|uniref:Transferase n=1 Tax=Streptomyces gossypii TaxID=2883101 RepID=A0ABT2JNL3_9ACTN|nr:hypothetical protein [Streptomyces gossypii]MCT2588955.1 hypothetical protein [Streptomyces gossypii]